MRDEKSDFVKSYKKMIKTLNLETPITVSFVYRRANCGVF
jgi:hypothetical protein